jgi:hypothetical protein
MVNLIETGYAVPELASFVLAIGVFFLEKEDTHAKTTFFLRYST